MSKFLFEKCHQKCSFPLNKKKKKKGTDTGHFSKGKFLHKLTSQNLGS